MKHFHLLYCAGTFRARRVGRTGFAAHRGKASQFGEISLVAFDGDYAVTFIGANVRVAGEEAIVVMCNARFGGLSRIRKHLNDVSGITYLNYSSIWQGFEQRKQNFLLVLEIIKSIRRGVPLAPRANETCFDPR